MALMLMGDCMCLAGRLQSNPQCSGPKNMVKNDTMIQLQEGKRETQTRNVHIMVELLYLVFWYLWN